MYIFVHFYFVLFIHSYFIINKEPIKIDNSVEEWINAIEENIKNNKQHRANRKETEENIGATKNVLINARFMKEIMKERSFSQMGYII